MAVAGDHAGLLPPTRETGANPVSWQRRGARKGFSPYGDVRAAQRLAAEAAERYPNDADLLNAHRILNTGHPLVGPPKGPLPCLPLGLDLILDDEGRLQFVERETGELVVREREIADRSIEALRQTEMALEQEVEARQEAEKRAAEEAEARRKAETELERLRARLEKLEDGDD